MFPHSATNPLSTNALGGSETNNTKVKLKKKKACIADTTAQMEDEFGGDVFFFIFLMKMKAIKGLIIPY